MNSYKLDRYQHHGIKVPVGNFTLSGYAPVRILHHNDLPNFTHTEATVLTGDLNARYRNLLDFTNNTNARRLILFLDAYHDVQTNDKNQDPSPKVPHRSIGLNQSYPNHNLIVLIILRVTIQQ